ncbi:site-specific integrase [Streptomyces flaveus]|uniref:site-specific integrase n=1 Tax=Streptomyces flaveus TaxID=66370 RepID=UPI0033263EFD
MPLLDLDKITAGLSTTWSGFLRDWDRSLRSGNYPETTRYNYLLAAAQLGRYLGEYSPDPGADAAAEDPVEVTRAHVEAFQAWMIETRSASTALNKHKGLQQFFKWLMLDEGEIDRSPMERVRQPKMPQKLVPVIPLGF